MEENARAHAYISGRVQGVAFRWETQRVAARHKVFGWVRNLPDGRVEAVFEGDADAVEEAVRYVEHGPPGARVDTVDVEREAPRSEGPGFEIRR